MAAGSSPKGDCPKDVLPSAPKNSLVEGRWMKGLQRVVSSEDIDQFINLWELLQNVQLTTEKDGIKWNLLIILSFRDDFNYMMLLKVM